MKKILGIIVMLLGLVVSYSLANTRVQNSYSDELSGAYNYAYKIGITTQSSIDTADMYGSLLRSHMAKMMVNYATTVLGKSPDTSLTCNFTDVNNQTNELQGYIKKACQLGLMGQDITVFSPNDIVTRAEFGTVLSRALYGHTNDGGNPYYINHLHALKSAGVMSDISNPNAYEIRGYVMLMMQRAGSLSNTSENNNSTTSTVNCNTSEMILACTLDMNTCPAECRLNNSSTTGNSTNDYNCQNVEFANGVTACVNITKVGTVERNLTTSITNGSTTNLECNLILPDGSSGIPTCYDDTPTCNGVIPTCNGTFSYDGDRTLSNLNHERFFSAPIKIFIRYNETAPIGRDGQSSQLNNGADQTYPLWTYDFANGGRITK